MDYTQIVEERKSTTDELTKSTEAGSPAQPAFEAPYDVQCWSAIEDHMGKYDSTMIKDYSDDIDTLLTFAGLFSGVVTAFIIESYTFLSPDNSGLQVDLLSRISTQLDGNNVTGVPPSLNSQFHVPPAVVAINVLWFSSLVFALAAALFGMTAKQWLREYLKWTSYSAPSREVIRLRHMRFEAFKEWDVAAFIATMPALLELALILFFCGLLSLLWTQNLPLSIILSVVVGIVISITVVVTILPTFYPRCPYKTPIGWGFVLLWTKAGIAMRYLHVLILRSRIRRKVMQLLNPQEFHDEAYSWHTYSWLPALQNWYKDMTNWRRRDLMEDVSPPWEKILIIPSANDLAARDLKQVGDLVRALDWVRADSQNETVLAHVRSCQKALHGTIDNTERHREVYRILQGVVLPLIGLQDLSCLEWHRQHPQHRTLFRHVLGLLPCMQIKMDAQTALVVCTIFTEDIKGFVDQIAVSDSDDQVVLQILELVCVTIGLVRQLRLSNRADCVALLTKIYNYFASHPRLFNRYPGFCATLYECLRSLGRVALDSDGLITFDTAGFMDAPEYAQMAIEMFRANPGCRNRDYCHIFVELCTWALCLCDFVQEQTKPVFTELFLVISQTMETAIERQQPNCGSHTTVRSWSYWMLAAADGVLVPLIPRALILNMQSGLDKDLLDDDSRDFQMLKERWEVLSSASVPQQSSRGAVPEKTDCVMTQQVPVLGATASEDEKSLQEWNDL